MSEALHKAIEKNDPKAAQKAIAGLKNINKKLTRDKTSLLLACENGADKVLVLLLDAGATFKAESIWEHPFGIAAFNGHRNVMKVLVARKQVENKVLIDVLRHVGRKGPKDIFEFILKEFKPPIDATTVRMVASSHDPQVIRLLAAAGGDLNETEDLDFHPKRTAPLHHLTWDEPLFRAMVECGANINIQDAQGRTPLMLLAQAAADQDRQAARVQAINGIQDRRGAVLALLGRPVKGPDGSNVMIQQILKLGAYAKLKDTDGNDALDYYRYETRRIKQPENPQTVELLKKAGAKGDEATYQLFHAKPGDIEAVKKAIAAGADVNRRSPSVTNPTPLINAAKNGDLEQVDLLLSAGADVNKYDRSMTPLIHASENGYLTVVKQLVEAGADLKARELVDRDEDCPAMNALETAELYDRKSVITYLKSQGATHEVRLLEAGVRTWDDFVQVLVKGNVAKVATALAKKIGGKVNEDAYGKSFKLGKNAYVVAQPKGMTWCNVLQLVPKPKGFDDLDNLSTFCGELAKASGLSVLWAGYGDTSAEADMMRFEPNGRTSQLPEINAALDKELTTSERLDQFAKDEKMVVAAFSLQGATLKKIEITFPGSPKELFDGVAFVSD